MESVCLELDCCYSKKFSPLQPLLTCQVVLESEILLHIFFFKTSSCQQRNSLLLKQKFSFLWLHVFINCSPDIVLKNTPHVLGQLLGVVERRGLPQNICAHNQNPHRVWWPAEDCNFWLSCPKHFQTKSVELLVKSSDQLGRSTAVFPSHSLPALLGPGHTERVEASASFFCCGHTKCVAVMQRGRDPARFGKGNGSGVDQIGSFSWGCLLCDNETLQGI